MRFWFIFLLLIGNACMAQDWSASVMAGTSAYNGDLTQSAVSVKRLNPAVAVNLKYNTGDFVDFRFGFAFEKVSANDKDNKSPFLQARNLNFKSNILEFTACIEFNLIDPQVYDQFPYVFAGLGVFHFNPYTYDDQNKKTYLQPLHTEGQGLSEYPSRKPYSLTQPCVPIGAGFKWKLNDKLQMNYEFGYRWLFTDYLDDVSKTYASLDVLNEKEGAKSAELSYRKVGTAFSEDGYPRGNPKVRDYYFFTGLSLSWKLGKN